MFVATKQVFCLSRQIRVCRDKTGFLTRQKYAYRDKTFVVTNMCIFVATKALSQQKHFVSTNVLSRQAPFSRQKLYLWQLSPANDIIHDLGFTDTSPDFSCVQPRRTKSPLDLLRYAHRTDTSLVRALSPIVALSRYSPYTQ